MSVATASVGAPRTGSATKAVLLGGSCFTLLAGASVSPALPGIYAEFQSTPNAALLSRGVLSIGPLFMAIGAALAGLLVDRIGRKPLLIASICGTGVFGTAGYFAWDLYSLLLTRVLLGLSVGGVMTACVTLLGDYFVEEERRRFLGWQTAAMKFGAVVFLLLGGLLAGISWRHPFLVDLLAFLVLPGAIWVVREPERRRAAAAPADAGVALSPAVPSASQAAAVRMVFALAFVTQVLFFAVPSQLPFFMTQTLGESPQRVGAVIAICTITSAVIAPLYPWLCRRVSAQSIFVMIFVLMGLGFLVLSASASIVGVALAMLIIGASVGFLLPNLSWALLGACSDTTRGRAVGGMNTSQYLGQFASPLVAALPVSLFGLPRTFAGLGVAALILAVGFLAFERRARRDAGSVAAPRG